MTDPFPDEVFFHHILPRLPTKSLFRFRCVCKSWHSFILNPLFLRLHRSITLTVGHLLFVSPSSAVATSEPQIFSAPIFRIHQDDVPPSRATLIATIPDRPASGVDVQCANGFLCLHPKNSSRSEAFAHVCNPTTRQIITLPDDSSIRNEFRASTHFGYDPIRDEFKVLRLLIYKDSHEFKIFTVGDAANSWRLVTAATQSVQQTGLGRVREEFV
ncbi:putative F-box protein At1g47790 [Prosopis cineraria]|uniref:putative F-box protein At1g47790 n=1 Tax=Prosopis cineraria TaxID=364024 RepID=UPI00240EAED5|nr:putative F-box protein At1g47790 [Prosopis cineraria]